MTRAAEVRRMLRATQRRVRIDGEDGSSGAGFPPGSPDTTRANTRAPTFFRGVRRTPERQHEVLASTRAPGVPGVSAATHRTAAPSRRAHNVPPAASRTSATLRSGP